MSVEMRRAIYLKSTTLFTYMYVKVNADSFYHSGTNVTNYPLPKKYSVQFDTHFNVIMQRLVYIRISFSVTYLHNTFDTLLLVMTMKQKYLMYS